MTSGWRERYRDKVMEVAQAVKLIRRGDYLYTGGGAGTPVPLLEGLVQCRDNLIDHEIRPSYYWARHRT